MKRLFSALAAALALAASPAVAEEVCAESEKRTKLSIEARLRAGTQVLPLPMDLPYIPFYPQASGMMWGGGATVEHGFGGAEPVTFSGGAFAYGVDTFDFKLVDSVESHALFPGAFLRLDKLPGIESLGVEGYTFHRLDAQAPVLWNIGGDISTAPVRPLGDAVGFSAKAGMRYGTAEAFVDPPMGYVLGGAEAGAFSLFGGAFLPLYEGAQLLIEGEWKAGKTKLEAQGFVDIKEDGGAGLYHDRLRLGLTRLFGGGITGGAHIEVSPHGLDEAFLTGTFTNVATRGLALDVVAGAAHDPVAHVYLPVARAEMAYTF